MYKTEIIRYEFNIDRDNILNSFLRKGYEFISTVKIESDKDMRKETITLKKVDSEQIKNDQKKFDKLDSEEFYDLLQSYRISNILDQSEVIKRFREIKEWIKKNL